ncbi:MAG: TetR family transcriptional regulator [Robiginitomaculum sp.]|nr:MAG: TetR family transcriptional regulator [Robiginitomaculum sp.]
MTHVISKKAQETKLHILEAARRVLLERGYAGLTTRGVAAMAQVPMSQIQYHFGSKEGMVLALFSHMHSQLLLRQSEMFSDQTLSLSQKWELACDYLDDDLSSGYVRVLQELWAAGWSNPEIGKTVKEGVFLWQNLLTEIAREAQKTYGSLGPFEPEDISALVGTIFIGAEAFLLLGFDEQSMPLRRALRRIGILLKTYEQQEKPEAI